MQWHPLFVDLLRPLVEKHYEFRTGQTVGDLPRWADVVVLRRTSASALPYKGIWRWLTTWNLLEYKGPTVSARREDIPDLLELGLGIHRRLNELQQKNRLPQLARPETSFWYLVNHLGGRFLKDVQSLLPGLQPLGDGLSRAEIFTHSVFLVSVRELRVDRDSLPLCVLSGVSEQDRTTVAGLVGSEPHLWLHYAAWLSAHEPEIWEEIRHMAKQKGRKSTPSLAPLAEYLREGGRVQDIKPFLEALGVKQAVEAVGVKQAVEAVGVKQLWENLSPEQREELLRLAQQDKPSPKGR